MRGRKPTPTNIKLLRGNPGKRAINRNEPKPSTKTPPCPHWLNLEAKREWRRLMPELRRMGLLTVFDRAAMAAYCEAWACYRAAQEIIDACGLTCSEPVLSKEGKVIGEIVKARPEVAIAHRYYQQMKALLTEFGFTPSSRGRMTVPGQAEQDDLNVLLG